MKYVAFAANGSADDVAFAANGSADDVALAANGSADDVALAANGSLLFEFESSKEVFGSVDEVIDEEMGAVLLVNTSVLKGSFSGLNIDSFRSLFKSSIFSCIPPMLKTLLLGKIVLEGSDFEELKRLS